MFEIGDVIYVAAQGRKALMLTERDGDPTEGPGWLAVDDAHGIDAFYEDMDFSSLGIQLLRKGLTPADVSPTRLWRYIGNVDSPHYGGRYQVLDITKHKHLGNWVRAVRYQNTVTGEVYSRIEADFIINFDRIGASG